MKTAIEDFEYLRARHPHKQVLKALFGLYGLSAAEIAKEAGVAKVTVYNAWSGRFRNPRVEAATSQRLWIPARELFGEKSNGRKR